MIGTLFYLIIEQAPACGFYEFLNLNAAAARALSTAATYDAIIIGGGHNGLVCAAYLGAAGLKTLVLEARDIIGGGAVTEEFHPGFRNSVAAYTVSLLQSEGHPRSRSCQAMGCASSPRKLANFLPLDNGNI